MFKVHIKVRLILLHLRNSLVLPVRILVQVKIRQRVKKTREAVIPAEDWILETQEKVTMQRIRKIKKMLVKIPTGHQISVDILTDLKIAVEIPTGRRVDAEIPTDRRVDVEIPTDRRADTEIPTDRRVDAEIPTDRRADAEIPIGRRVDGGILTDRQCVEGVQTDLIGEMEMDHVVRTLLLQPPDLEVFDRGRMQEKIPNPDLDEVA